MRGSARSRNTANVSLFPFLAVLLCTMGALIVVLVVIAQQARSEAERRESSQLETLAAQRAAAMAKAAELDTQRQELSRHRDVLLSEIETRQSELDKLTEQRQGLERGLQELATQQPSLPKADFEARKQELDRKLDWYRERIAKTEEQIREANQRRGNGKTYAVLPYRGRNGTGRRPIYLECRADRVVLQPEGIELLATDFMPGRALSPLSAALLATVDYYHRGDPTEKEKPYPMLLVRPDGIEAYYKVVETLQNWRSEFGYEFIEQDWELQLPPADKVLGTAQLEAVEMARKQMLRELRTRPSLVRGAPPSFSVTSSGGLKMVDPGDSPSGGLPDRYGADPRGNARETTRGPGYPEQPFASNSGDGFGRGGSGGTSMTGNGSGNGGSLTGESAQGGGRTPYDQFAGNSIGAGPRYDTSYNTGTNSGSRYPELGSPGRTPGGAAAADGYAAGGYPPNLTGPGAAASGAPGTGSAAMGYPGAEYSSAGGSGMGNTPGSAQRSPGTGGQANQPGGSGSGFGWGSGQQGSGQQRGGETVNPYAHIEVPGQGGLGTGGPTLNAPGSEQASNLGTNGGAPNSSPGDAQTTLGAAGSPGTPGGTSSQHKPGASSPSGGSPSGLAQSGNSQSPGGGAMAGQTSSGGQPSAGSSSGASGSASDGASQSSSSGGGGGSPGSSQPAGAGAPSMSFQRSPAKHSVASQAGSNWALPSASQRSVAVLRNVRAQLDDERLLLLSETGRVTQLVPLRETTAASAYEIRNAVWQEMENWGMAGYGMHWQPSLQIEVQPGGEHRFRDMETLFDNSGFAIRNKQRAASPAVQPRR